MALPTPPHHSDPIPNNPFYSSRDYGVQGLNGYLIIGTGLSVSLDGVLSATGSWDGQIVAGDGISVSGTTEITISLTNTGVTAGSYSNATLSVDYQGRITSIVGGGVPVLRDDFTAKGTLLAGTGDESYTALGLGPDGAVLTADSLSATGMAWLPLGSGGGNPATPNCFGTVLGYTSTGVNSNLSLGYKAGEGLIDGCSNIAIGKDAMRTGCAEQSVAIGQQALSISDGYGNVAIGYRTYDSTPTGKCNVFVGHRVARDARCTSQSVIIGAGAGQAFGGNRCYLNSVLIGPNVVGVETGLTCSHECELAIGFDMDKLWLSGDRTKALKPGAGIRDCTGNLGTSGQVLTSLGTAEAPDGPGEGGALLWVDPSGGGGANPATPTAFGTVLGQTNSDNFNVSLDGTCGALASNTDGQANVALGAQTLPLNTLGSYNSAVGTGASSANTCGSYNTALGFFALRENVIGTSNTAIGSLALCRATGNCNVAVGLGAGCDLVLGNYNVAIGPDAQLLSTEANCQLAIGFSAGCNWITGDCTKAIKPGAGIIDCCNSCGTPGAVLRVGTDANTICWSTEGLTATCVIGGSTVVIKNGLIVSVT